MATFKIVFSDAVAYGFNASLNQKRFVNTGRNRGLRLLLDAHQEEYCGIYSKWYGVGFEVYVQDFDRLQSGVNYGSLSLSPGYHTNVIVKQRTFDRKTEFMGLCKSKMDFFLIPSSVDRYLDELCYVHCTADMIWRHCKCFLFKVESMIKLAKIHYRVQYLPICSPAEMKCTKKLSTEVLSTTNTARLCGCKPACYENTYEYTVSTLVFPPKHVVSPKDYNYSDYNRATKNAALVSFVFDNKLVQVVIESQLFTFTDLLMYIGGSFSLFLGWSVTVLTGLTLHTAFYFYVYCILYMKRKFTVTPAANSIIERKHRFVHNQIRQINIGEETI